MTYHGFTILIYFYFSSRNTQTEGFGPLFFGGLMSLFEHSSQPGAPFILATMLSLWAFLHCFELPPEGDMYTLKLDAHRKGREEGMGLLYNDTDVEDLYE